MLNELQIRSKVRERNKVSALGAITRHQNWVKLHADTALDNSKCLEPYMQFMKMVETLLPSEKYNMFKSLLRFPLPSTEVVSVVFDRLSRIFEGRNPAISYEFTKTKYADNWAWYKKYKLNEPDVWKTTGWDFYKTEPNSVLVVDMPESREEGDEYVQPYFYWVKVEDIIDYDTNENGGIEWIIFKNDDLKKVYCFDDTYYRSFDYTERFDELSKDFLESRHGLGYCPATFFVEQPVSLARPDVKESPISKALSDLDWYNFYVTSKKHLDLYGSYPIYYGYEPNCDYSEQLADGHSHHCEGGFLKDENGAYVVDMDGKPKACPQCSGHRTAGAGSYIEVPVPDEGDIDIGDHPVGMLKVDIDALQFNADEAQRKKKEIIATCVGVDGDALNEFSVSDKQVDANYESQSTILIRVKKTFERAQKFVDDTICKLRYGNEFVDSSINYGTEFYTLTTSELRARYQKAEESGAPESDLLSLRKQIIETEYRNNPLQMERMLILTDIEPLIGLTKNAAIEACNKGFVDEYDVRIKLNFDSLIKRFEREQMNVIEFGAKMPYEEKIKTIKDTLKDYVTDIRVKSNDSSSVSQDAE